MALWLFAPECPEISDLIVSFDPRTLARLPVRKEEVLRRFAELGDGEAARVVEALPARDGILDPGAVDRLLRAVHLELQRMSEEFQHGRRIRELLSPVFAVFRENGVPRPWRVVDLGCGAGFVIRWLAARGGLGPEVELVGVDFNAALVEEARRLAAAENLRCAFTAADAFRLAEPATVLISTGVLHHFRGPELGRLLAAHERPGTEAFLHFDFQPSPLAGPGAWLFHVTRMRQPLAHHDGVLSAVRAYSGTALLEAARAAAPGFAVGLFGRRFLGLPIPRVFQTLIGLRPGLREGFVRALGARASRLESLR